MLFLQLWSIQTVKAHGTNIKMRTTFYTRAAIPIIRCSVARHHQAYLSFAFVKLHNRRISVIEIAAKFTYSHLSQKRTFLGVAANVVRGFVITIFAALLAYLGGDEKIATLQIVHSPGIIIVQHDADIRGDGVTRQVESVTVWRADGYHAVSHWDSGPRIQGDFQLLRHCWKVEKFLEYLIYYHFIKYWLLKLKEIFI